MPSIGSMAVSTARAYIVVHSAAHVTSRGGNLGFIDGCIELGGLVLLSIELSISHKECGNITKTKSTMETFTSALSSSAVLDVDVEANDRLIQPSNAIRRRSAATSSGDRRIPITDHDPEKDKDELSFCEKYILLPWLVLSTVITTSAAVFSTFYLLCGLVFFGLGSDTLSTFVYGVLIVPFFLSFGVSMMWMAYANRIKSLAIFFSLTPLFHPTSRGIVWMMLGRFQK